MKLFTTLLVDYLQQRHNVEFPWVFHSALYGLQGLFRDRHFGAMGCGLRKMKPVSEESSPGKIYSTLKRPQVETKVGVDYTYRYLDFLIGKDGKR